MSARFRVGITRDILNSRNEPAFGKAALQILDAQLDPLVLLKAVRSIEGVYDCYRVGATR